MDLYSKKFWRSAVVSAHLGLAASAVAQDAPPPPVNPDIYGSQQTKDSLAFMKEDFLATAGRDVFVLALHDLVGREDILKARVFEHMGVPTTDLYPIAAMMPAYEKLLEENEEILPAILQAKNKGVLVDFGRYFLDQRILGSAINSFPISWSTPDKQNACVIVAPEPDQNPSLLLAKVAVLPFSMASLMKVTITEEDVYELLMLHEAHHCTQEKNIPTDPIESSLQRLGFEIEADTVSFDIFRKRHAHEPERAERVINEFRMARSIANIRDGGNMTGGPDNYLGHGIIPVTTSHDIGEADLVVSSKMINLAFSIITSAQLGLLPETPEYNSLVSHNATMKDFTGATDLWVGGAAMRQQYPMIEYATIRTVYDMLTENPVTAAFFTMEYEERGVADILLRDYLQAFETLFPSAKSHPAVQAQQNFVRLKISEFLTKPLAPISFNEIPVDGTVNTCGAMILRNAPSQEILRGIEDWKLCNDSLLKPPVPVSP